MGHLNVGVWRGFSMIWGLTRKIAGEKPTKLPAGPFELLDSFLKSSVRASARPAGEGQETQHDPAHGSRPSFHRR